MEIKHKMSIGAKNWFLIIFVVVIISAICVTAGLIIYDRTMAPNDLKKQVENINNYLARLITNFTVPT
jgi:hypothetical protein